MDYVFGTDVWDGSVVSATAQFGPAGLGLDRLVAGGPVESGGSVDYAALSNIFTATTRNLGDAIRTGADVWAQITGGQTTAQRDMLFNWQLAQAAQQQQQQMQWGSLVPLALLAGGAFLVFKLVK